MGLLLLSRGCITQDQFQRALAIQRSEGGFLGTILRNLNFATERQIAAAVATQWGCPMVSPSSRFSQVGLQIPKALMDRYQMVPLHYSSTTKRLLVGFVHGIEHHVLHAIEKIGALTAAPCLITSSDHREILRGCASHGDDVAFEGMASTLEIAGIVRNYAFQVAAEEARVAVCHDYVWARLNGAGHCTDLLFAISREGLCEQRAERN